MRHQRRAVPSATIRRARWLSAVLLLVLASSACGGPEPRVVESETRIFTLDRVFKSMFGPRDRDRLTLLESEEPEVLWVTAIAAQMVGADGVAPQSPEFFCHSAFSRIPTPPQEAARRELLGRRLGRARKMFTLVQGLLEIRFPEGFGMPVLSNDEFVLTAMAMNPIERPEPVRVGVDSRIEFVREADAPGQMKPLYLVPLVAKVPVATHRAHASHALLHDDDASHALTEGDAPEHHGDGETCLSHDGDEQVAASVDRSSTDIGSPVTVNEAGYEQTGHWHVPPGHHEYRYVVEDLARWMPWDTRAHYISAHLHPFGTSLELVDRTTGETVFRAEAENFPDRVALREITSYSSVEGKPVHRDHEYELIATYDNTTDDDVDSMAVMYLYLADANPAPRLARR